MFDDVDRNRAHLPATRERTPSSRVLEDLLRQAPPDQFTLGWVLSTLHQRSFGVVIPFLGVLATAPRRVVGARDYAHSVAVHFRAIYH